jgi:ketosteroid isomerase-like protein
MPVSLAARLTAIAGLLLAVGCLSRPARSTDLAARDSAAAMELNAVNARLSDAYRRRDPAAYAALFTDTAVFEWPAIAPVRGPAALGAMGRAIWAGQRDVDLRVRVASRRVAADHATEFGAFEQTWTDTAGVRRTEFGRYVTALVRQPDGRWLMDRWLGFEDSVRVAAPGR